MDEKDRLVREAQLLQTPEWLEFMNLINSLPRDYEFYKIPIAPNKISLFDLLAGAGAKETEPAPAKMYQLHKGEFTRIPNPGGGNCLYHALEGYNLSDDELKPLRTEIAAVRLGLPETDHYANALYTAAILMETPATQPLAARLTSGRCKISNPILASLQKVPGMHAGEYEIYQWCLLRQKKVFIYYQSEKYLRISPEGSTQVFPDARELLQEFSQADTALYYQLGHWRKLESISPAILAS